MPVKVLCPNPDCDASYSVQPDVLGRLGRCKKCGTVFPLNAETRPDAAATTDPWLDPADLGLPSSFGRFRIEKKLGQGGMGAVYLAHDTELDRPVALKVPHFLPGESPEVLDRFRREARAAAGFHHPNFCPIYDVGRIDGVHFLAMAFIEGQTLAALIRRERALPQRRAAEIARTLALALAEAHRRGVIHRDLKPANVMVTPRGELVLMDFGLARRSGTDDPELTRSGAVMGTPHYMPPEQVEGDRQAIGPGADIYSLGVILHELLTGRRPFEGPPALVLGLIMVAEPSAPSSHRSDLDPELEAICRRAMARKVAGRYPSMEAFAEALGAYLERMSHPSPPRPTTQVEPPRPDSSASPVAFGTVSLPGARPSVGGPNRRPSARGCASRGTGCSPRRR